MTKLNNKGISLVELIIAVAVMAILIAPIITQTFVTLETSSKSKEKQYVVESAEEVMEYFRKTDKQDYSKPGNADGVVKIDSIGAELTANCAIFNSDGSDTGKVVKYTYTNYTLDSIKLGKKKNTYNRLVTISDLNNKLSELGYEVDYQTYVNGSSLPDGKLDGFEIGSDNTVAKFSTDVEGNDYISAIVCKKRDKGSPDPNTESLGNIQDMDASKMAIISGDATSLDYELESALTSMLIQYANEEYLKGNENTNDLAALVNDPKKLNSKIKAIVNNNNSADDTVYSRLINISVTSSMNESGTGYELDSDGTPKYYHVKCDVIYKIKFKDHKPFNGSNIGQLVFNVLDRDYYTSESPDIFMAYEPLLIDTSANATSPANYAHDEYLTIETDKYTSGNIDKTDPSKLYLIKSTKNWANVMGTKNINPTGNDGQFLNCYYYYTGIGNKVQPVKIHVNQIQNDFEKDKQEPIQIVTNISSYDNGTKLCPPFDGSYLLQFDVEKIVNDTTPSPLMDSNGKYLDPSKTANRIAYKKKLNTVKDSSGNKADSIVAWGKDSRYDGRLFRMTVSYENSKGEKTYLTGAKGAD